MSFSESLLTSIDKTVVSYIEKISGLYSLNKDDLVAIWKGGNGGDKEVPNELLALNRNELVELCKSKNLKFGGTKNDLIQRLLTGVETKKAEPQVALPTPKLISKPEPTAIHRNKFGNFEHNETGFVFNQVTTAVFGKQNADGSISSLTVEDINLCNKYKFTYNIPSKLSGTEKVELAELDEDDVEVIEIDEDEEEEEEEDEIEVELEIDDDD